MKSQHSHNNQEQNIHRLTALPLIAAQEFFPSQIDTEQAEPTQVTETTSPQSPFDDEREYKLCKIILEHPLKPSSQYPQLIRVSHATAASLRRILVRKEFIRERVVDSSGRGRSSILLEIQDEGVAAVAEYEAHKG